MKSGLPSDRGKAELSGPVKTVADDWSTTVFDRDGKILEWHGNTFDGHADRTYSYDQDGRLLRITGNNGDQVDEFRYDEHGLMTQVRHIPPRPARRNTATAAQIAFEAISEGDTLIDGGTVETSYNEGGQPVEKRIADDEGTLLSRILYAYDANGRLAEERLVTENFGLPKSVRDQIPSEQRAAVLAQLKTEMETAARGLFGNAERNYVYTTEGRLAERHMRMGPVREDVVWTFGSRGDLTELTRRTTGVPNELGTQEQLHSKCLYSYEYDDHGNWIRKTETWEVAGNTTVLTNLRQLTYYS